MKSYSRIWNFFILHHGCHYFENFLILLVNKLFRFFFLHNSSLILYFFFLYLLQSTYLSSFHGILFILFYYFNFLFVFSLCVFLTINAAQINNLFTRRIEILLIQFFFCFVIFIFLFSFFLSFFLLILFFHFRFEEMNPLKTI